jgi:hypothetical protein
VILGFLSELTPAQQGGPRQEIDSTPVPEKGFFSGDKYEI